MSEANDTAEEAPARGNKRAPRTRQRRNYVAELADLQTRVKIALKLLERQPRDIAITDAAVEILKGE